MTRPRVNVRVVDSDSEPDLDDDSDESADDANATKRSPSHLGSNTKPSTGNSADNSNDDDLGDTSGESDDDTPSAISSNRDPSCRNSTIRSDNDTPSPIEGSNTVKRKADKWGIDPHNIISPSPRAFNEPSSSQNDDEHPRKRQRLTRGHGRSTVSYDMKHHPMDDVLRPKYSAKRRANGNQVPEESSDSDEDIDENDTNDAPSRKVTSSNLHRRRSSRNTHRSETPIYSAKWHPLDQMLIDNASSTSASKKNNDGKKSRKQSNDSFSTLTDEADFVTVNSDLNLDQDAADDASGSGGGTAPPAPISPHRRRSTRVSSKDTPPDYDMKYHVMDSTLRPKAAAKRMKSKLHLASTPHTSSKTSSKSVSSAKTPTKKLAKASPKSSPRRSIHPESELDNSDVPVAPAWSRLQNPYLNRSSLDWAELQQMDRCVYLQQKGAPLHGNTLPQDWTNDIIKRVLFDEGVITLDELNSREGTELLKIRYESVRLGLQNFFGSKPEPVSKNDWTLSKTEGFDVYDMKQGSRYWRHEKNSVVEGTKTSSSFNIPSFAVETAKQMTGNNYQEATDSIPKEKDRNEAKAPTSRQYAKNERSNPKESSLKGPPALEVDPARTTFADHEDNGELGVIIETENTLVEGMRGEYIPSSIMSDEALEQLLSPIEQYLKEEPGQKVTADMVSCEPRSSVSGGLVTAHPNKTLDEPSSIASKATSTDLDTSSHRPLAGNVPLDKKEMAPSLNIRPRNGSGEPQTPKAEVRKRKRKSRIDVAIAVHEDLPGRTPLVKKIVDMNPASPGTDRPKENLEDDSSVGHSSQVEIGTPPTRRHHEAIETLSTRRVRLMSTMTATSPYQSLFGGPLGSSSSDSSSTMR